MAMAGETGTDKWVSKFEDSKRRYSQRVETLKLEIRADESLSDLERAVLGATGSAEELKRYQDLALKVGRLSGQPIVALQRVEKSKVVEAHAGIISGPAEVELDYHESIHGGRRAKDGFTGSKIRVPVTPGVVYHDFRNTGRHPANDSKSLFFDSESSMYDRDEEQSYVTIARFSVPYEFEHSSRQIDDPYQNFTNGIDLGSVLVGKETIYNSSYFTIGLSKILLGLEGHAADAPHTSGLRAVS